MAFPSIKTILMHNIYLQYILYFFNMLNYPLQIPKPWYKYFIFHNIFKKYINFEKKILNLDQGKAHYLDLILIIIIMIIS